MDLAAASADGTGATVQHSATHHKRELIYSIQQIRAAAAFMVVLTHVWGALHSVPGTVTIDFREINIGFTFAAGYLFHALSLNRPYRTFLEGRVRNVVIPYLIVSAPAVAVYAFGHKTHPHVDLSQLAAWQLPLYLYATGLHLGPLWFVPMIMIIYAATPLLRLIDRHNAYWLALPLALVGSMTLFERPEFNEMPPVAAAHYVPIFLFGMVASRYRLQIEPVARRLWPLALVLLIGLWSLSAWLDDHTQWPVKIVMLGCMHAVTVRTQALRSVVIDVLAKYSFGIFFLHGYFASVLRLLEGKGVVIDATLLNALLISLLVVGICVAVIAVLRTVMRSKSRYIVGV